MTQTEGNGPTGPDDWKPPTRQERREKLQDEIHDLARRGWEPLTVTDFVAVVIRARVFANRVRRLVVMVDDRGEIATSESEISAILHDD